MPNPRGNPETLKQFKSQWKSVKTRTIRVPIAIAEQVLEAARLIDENQSFNTDTSGIDKTKIIQIARNAFSLKASSGGKIKDAIAEILNEVDISAKRIKGKWEITDTSDSTLDM